MTSDPFGFRLAATRAIQERVWTTMFEGFKGSAGVQLNPRAALVATMIYLSSADGRVEDSEIGDILKIVPDRAALDTAVQYTKRASFAQFLDETARMLSPQQKMCAILNAADLAMGDGHLAAPETAMLRQIAAAWQIPDQYLTPYIHALMAKNNIAVFG